MPFKYHSASLIRRDDPSIEKHPSLSLAPKGRHLCRNGHNITIKPQRGGICIPFISTEQYVYIQLRLLIVQQHHKIELLNVVALTQEVPEHNLKRGEVGTVVEILSNGEAYEVEFSDDNGQMYKCLSFLASQLRILHHEPIVESKQKQESTIRKKSRCTTSHQSNGKTTTSHR